MSRASAPRRWIVVADSPFLPAQGGGEREHLGFVESAVAAGLLAALVVPIDPDPTAVGRTDDLKAIGDLIAPAPLITVPRVRSAIRAGLSPRRPYVVGSRPSPRGLVDQVRALGLEADGIVLFSYKSHRIGNTLAEGLQLPVVLRHHNLEGTYHRSLAASARPPRSWAVGLEAARIERDERRLERPDSWLTGIADISAVDAETRSARSSVPVRYVSSFALGPRSADPVQPWRRPGGSTVVFLGALDVATNHEAVRWFADHVWPLVRADVPDATLQVVGRRPGADMVRMVEAIPGASLHPDVPATEPYLRGARVALNPAVSGSGVNIKLVEYLALGVPVVSTTRGMAGLGLQAGTDLLIGDDAASFGAGVVRLLTSDRTADRIAAQGRSAALRILDTDTGLAAIQELLAAESIVDNVGRSA